MTTDLSDVHYLVFDCDGVLVDSQPVIDRCWHDWALRFGCDPAAVLAAINGRRAVEVVALFLPPPQHEAALRVITDLELADVAGVTAVPGAGPLLRSLPPGRWAVVTSGARELARARLAAAGLPEPSLLIAAEDVTRGKPDPEGYQSAMRTLGADPAACAIAEDSPAGLAAARASGAGLVIGVGAAAAQAHPDALAHPEVRVADLSALCWAGGALTIAEEVRP